MFTSSHKTVLIVLASNLLFFLIISTNQLPLLLITNILQTGQLLHSVKEHTMLIKDMQLSSDQMMLVTASKDKTAKVTIKLHIFHLKKFFSGYNLT